LNKTAVCGVADAMAETATEACADATDSPRVTSETLLLTESRRSLTGGPVGAVLFNGGPLC